MAGAVSAAAAPRAAWGKPPGQLVLPQHAPVRTAVWLLSERFRSGQCCSSLPPLFAVRSRRWFEQHADETWPNGDRPSIQHAWDHCKCLRTLDQVGGGGCPGPLPPTAREQQRHRGTATRQQLPRSCPADSTMTRGTRALAERLEVLRSCPRRGRWSSYFLALTTHWHL